MVAKPFVDMAWIMNETLVFLILHWNEPMKSSQVEALGPAWGIMRIYWEKKLTDLEIKSPLLFLSYQVITLPFPISFQLLSGSALKHIFYCIERLSFFSYSGYTTYRKCKLIQLGETGRWIVDCETL